MPHTPPGHPLHGSDRDRRLGSAQPVLPAGARRPALGAGGVRPAHARPHPRRRQPGPAGRRGGRLAGRGHPHHHAAALHAAAELSRRGFPFVLLNRETDDAPGDACVVDNRAGARLIAEELLGLGHRAIAAAFGPETTSTGRDREAAFRQVLVDAGVDLPPKRWRRAPFDFDEGHRCALELLPSRPTALFAANDILALGAYNALYAEGLRVPADITPIGFDDVKLAGWEASQLTTVSQDLDRMVKTSMEPLLSRHRRRTRGAPGAAAGGAAGAAGAAGHARPASGLGLGLGVGRVGNSWGALRG